MCDVIEEFRLDPVGFTVELHDGRQGDVSAYRDTPRGRWIRFRCRGPWQIWVPLHKVRNVITFELSLAPANMPVRSPSGSLRARGSR